MKYTKLLALSLLGIVFNAGFVECASSPTGRKKPRTGNSALASIPEEAPCLKTSLAQKAPDLFAAVSQPERQKILYYVQHFSPAFPGIEGAINGPLFPGLIDKRYFWDHPSLGFVRGVDQLQVLMAVDDNGRVTKLGSEFLRDDEIDPELGAVFCDVSQLMNTRAVGAKRS